jgi:dTMP kinase
MIIAIEGMDGCGKTTIAKYVSNVYNFKYIDKPLKFLFSDDLEKGNKILSSISSIIYDIDDPVIKSWFFGLGNLLTVRKFGDSNLIIDRHFASNYFWNGSSESEIVFQTMKEIIGVPDITIVLYATVNTRIERLKKRNPEDKDIFDPEKRVDGYEKMLSFLDKSLIPHVIINTENKTISDVFAEVSKIIEEKMIENEVKGAKQHVIY